MSQEKMHAEVQKQLDYMNRDDTSRQLPITY